MCSDFLSCWEVQGSLLPEAGPEIRGQVHVLMVSDRMPFLRREPPWFPGPVYLRVPLPLSEQ